MWLLGGEVIRDVNEEPHLRKRSAEQLVRSVIHEDGGPLIHNGCQDEQQSFDSTCRKLHRFLTQSERRDPISFSRQRECEFNSHPGRRLPLRR